MHVDGMALNRTPQTSACRSEEYRPWQYGFVSILSGSEIFVSQLTYTLRILAAGRPCPHVPQTVSRIRLQTEGTWRDSTALSCLA